MSVMAKEKPRTDDADVNVNTLIEGRLRKQMDAYIADHNANDENEHRASIRSTIEAALRAFLKDKGFWPPPKPEAK